VSKPFGCDNEIFVVNPDVVETLAGGEPSQPTNSGTL
jgi:hypothetical protein